MSHENDYNAELYRAELRHVQAYRDFDRELRKDEAKRLVEERKEEREAVAKFRRRVLNLEKMRRIDEARIADALELLASIAARFEDFAEGMAKALADKLEKAIEGQHEAQGKGETNV